LIGTGSRTVADGLCSQQVAVLEQAASWDRAAVVTTFGYRNHAVTGYRYRYLTYSDGSEELYDLETDPNEWTNRADDPALGHIKAELAAWLPRHDEPDARGL
jgi:hypothetical protein